VRERTENPTRPDDIHLPLTTQILGDEFDDALRTKLGDVLRQFGARKEATEIRGTAGSQEVESMVFTVNGETLKVESETYTGLSIHGPKDLVLKIKRAELGEP
jgi:hypothetical protein